MPMQERLLADVLADVHIQPKFMTLRTVSVHWTPQLNKREDTHI